MATLLKSVREMTPRIAGSRWVSILLLVSALGLVVLVAMDLPARFPKLAPLRQKSSGVRERLPLEKVQGLFAPDLLQSWRPAENGQHAFHTLHFVPPPPVQKPPPPAEVKPTPPPEPPPPKTTKLAMIYQGLYQTTAGQKKAFLHVNGQQAILQPGAKVAADWAVAEIALRKLTLTNATGQTNILEFNNKKELEVPLP